MIKIIVSATAGTLETATNEAITDLTTDGMTISGVAVSVGDSVPWYAVITYAEATTNSGTNSGTGGDTSGNSGTTGD